MFGLSQQEKQQKVKTQYNNELKDLLVSINSNLDNNTLRGNLAILSGGYDKADALHNVYEDFGYPCKLDFFNFWNMYRRFGPAKAIVRIPPNLSWLTPPEIKGSDKFEAEFERLVKATKLWNRVKGLDIRQRVGRYAGLFIQVSDGGKTDEELGSLNGIGNIINLKPMYENQLDVLTVETDINSDNYNNPTMYQFRPAVTGNRNDDETSSFNIHPSRLIIAAEDSDDGSIYGISSLEASFNDLMDLRKISGAGGEGFYQNTRSAPVIEVDAEYQPLETKEEREALNDEVDAFLSKWQKKFVAQGMKFVYPDIKLDSPKEFAENSWNNISADTGISTNIFRGVQTGVLAGDKDDKSTMVMIQSRRENFLTELVTDIVDWFIEHGVLPFSEYKIEWDDMTAAGDSQKLDLAKKMSEVNEKSFKSGMPAIFSEDEIREVSGRDPKAFEIPNESLKVDDFVDDE